MEKVDPDYALRGAVSGLIWERNNLETLNDMLAQALDAAIQERDEARTWARRMRRELQEMTAYADKLADGLPILPKDIEVIRQANWALAEENHRLKERCSELEARLDIEYGNLADIEPPSFVKGAE